MVQRDVKKDWFMGNLCHLVYNCELKDQILCDLMGSFFL